MLRFTTLKSLISILTLFLIMMFWFIITVKVVNTKMVINPQKEQVTYMHQTVQIKKQNKFLIIAELSIVRI